MKRCPHCAAEVLERATVCSHCRSMVDGASSEKAAMLARRKRRVARIGLLVLALAAGAALASPVYHGWRSGGCEPRSWVDWHLAMRQQCLTPAYVCENMTTPRMLRDPDVAAAYREALVSGMPNPVPGLGEMIGRMRLSYGCSPEPGARLEAPGKTQEGHSAALPPGHPPIPRGSPAFGFETAPTTTL